MPKQEAPQSMYPKVIVKEQVHDHVESLEGLRYLVRFGVENVAPDESYAKARQICVSNLAMRTLPNAKDNDYLIGKMNEKAFKRVSTPKPHASGKVNLVCVDVGKARGTNPTFGVQNRPKIKDHNRPSILKDKTCITKLKS
ncbi:unnamed protein product [Lactuca virosa]|uniref:Uncharacterized protein n=1 Tax=Lactuca virosa TaxID=75947 RepID=A0AAU9PAZ0_9ASTR|nr:unnamed protein product [Lactuca virosa]